MREYPIKKYNIDFIVEEGNVNTKGTRKKKIVRDKNNKSKAFFKYQGKDYITSELCSEKMCYEIAKVLGYECAKIEFAEDEKKENGILNYLFVTETIEHFDIAHYINPEGKKQKDFYTLEIIKKTLDGIGDNLWAGFIRIMIFDALVGEQDRHEENWGISYSNGRNIISPLYDNGCNLLDKFKLEAYAEKYYADDNEFEKYINRSSSQIRIPSTNKKYKHFDLIKKLNDENHEIVQRELEKLKKLDDEAIKRIVNMVPKEMLTEKHKEYIIKYLIKRRDILLDIK